MDIFDKILKVVEKFIIVTLIVLMAIVLVFGVIEVSIIILKEVFSSIESGNFLLNRTGLMEIFDFFLIVLIGFELFETVKFNPSFKT
jgi:uncharacterized membrane protein (DUF373 family)